MRRDAAAAAVAAAVTAIVRPRLAACGAACQHRAGKLQSSSYRLYRHIKQIIIYLFVMSFSSQGRSSQGGTIPALLELLPTCAIAPAMSQTTVPCKVTRVKIVTKHSVISRYC